MRLETTFSRRFGFAFAAGLAIGAIALGTDASAAPRIQFLGEEILPTGLQFEGTEVGGLSRIAYDAEPTATTPSPTTRASSTPLATTPSSSTSPTATSTRATSSSTT